MPGKIPPPLALTLTVLRSAQGWSQKRLAEVSGVRKTMISDFEVGRRPLSRTRLEALAAVLGYGSESIDATLLCLEWVCPQVEASTSPLGPAVDERRIIEQASARAAKRVLDAIRSTLTSQLRAHRARQSREEAEEQWERLKRYSSRDRRLLVEGAEEFQTWALCERLCAESEKAAAADANRALDLADLAFRVSLLVPGEEDWRSRVQGYAWAHVGNARRVASDLPGADDAFARCRKLWGSGNPDDPDPLDEGRVLDLEASLRRDQRRTAEALELLDMALLKKSSGQTAGRILLKKAFALEQIGHHQRALETLVQAAPFVEEQSDPRLLCVLRFNLAVNLCHLGRHLEAQALLPEIRELAVRLGNALDVVRVLWLEGRIWTGLRKYREALAALEQVRTDFISRGLAYDAALASLELAVIYLEQQRTTEVKILVRQMASIFQAQGVHREALAALRLFCDAVEQEVASADLARRVVQFLQRARYDSQLQFEA